MKEGQTLSTVGCNELKEKVHMMGEGRAQRLCVALGDLLVALAYYSVLYYFKPPKNMIWHGQWHWASHLTNPKSSIACLHVWCVISNGILEALKAVAVHWLG